MHKSWNDWISKRSRENDFKQAKAYVKKRQAEGHIVYPPNNKVMHAFDYSLDNIKVVILGQDPYHGPEQAHGLAFSVKNEIPPPSLKNIIKEVKAEGFKPQEKVLKGNLETWAEQGVFLLNCFLTVEKSKPKSHHKIGWETFTDSVISYLSEYHNNIVFILWGNSSKEKEKLIDSNRHYILKSPHPSGFSAHKGFFGNNHFILANKYLEKYNKTGINW